MCFSHIQVNSKLREKTEKPIKICLIAAVIKKCKSLINKRKKHNNIVLLAKTKLNTVDVLICEALIDSNILLAQYLLKKIYHEFVSVNNVLKEYE